MPQSQIDATLTLWLVAVAPLVAILVLLVGLRWKAASAAPVGFFLAVLAAFIFFQAPARNVALQSVKGVWDALFIIYVIVPALLLYQVSKRAGAFESLRHGIESVTPNNLLHVLGFGWVFASFLQGITGFGAPIAVTAPLLVAVGVRPIWAVIIPLIGHAWNNTFGTLAVAWEGLNLVTDIENPMLTAGLAAGMLLIGNLLAGFAIAWIYGRMRGVREGLLVILVISSIHGVGQVILAPLIPTLAGFVPGTLAVGALFLLARTKMYSGDSEVTDSPIMAEENQIEAGKKAQHEGEKTAGEGDMSLFLALSPYLALIVLILVAQLIPPVTDVMEAFEIGLAFPELETGLNYTVEAQEAYSAFSPLTHPGTFLLAAAIFAYVLYRGRGYLADDEVRNVFVQTVKSSIPSSIALLAFVPLALVMEGSGQILVLALGVGTVAPGPVYVFLSPLIGGLGSFMTSSNMTSNILLGPLQEQTAQTLELPEAVVLAGQTAGGAIANCMAPGNVLLGTGAVGEAGKEGDVIRVTVVYALIFLVLAGVFALVASGLINGG
jgi:lactate permease